MKIRVKIILIVLPLLIVMMVITAASATFLATAGINRIAGEFLHFKVEELEKYAQGQWNILAENDLTGRANMVASARAAVADYAETLVRSDTELLFALSGDGEKAFTTGELTIDGDDASALVLAAGRGGEGLIRRELGGVERVASGFYFEPFGWYLFVSEEVETFYSEVNKIQAYSLYILGGGALLSIVLLLIFINILTSPLSRVVSAMKAIISTNDLSRKVEVEYADEIGTLSHTFNIMTSELEKAYTQIKTFAFDAVLAKKKEERIRNIFQKYVPQDLIDKFFQNPESMLVGDNRVLSILFSDIRSFTTISESMQPDDLVNSLNRYFSIMVDIIMKRNGVIDKYIGDAIMAFFGAPVKRDDDAINSVHAALDMVDALVEFNKKQLETGKPEFHIGIGLNYGIVTVGNIGSEQKMDYTVIGDMVNLASRMEGLTKRYQQSILISESLYRKVREEVPCRPIDKVAVKGKTIGVPIYTPRRELSPAEEKAWQRHRQGMELYYQREFVRAGEAFRNVLETLPGDYPAEMMVSRCAAYEKNPPPEGWDGVEIMTSK